MTASTPAKSAPLRLVTPEVPSAQVRPEPPVRGERILQALEGLFLRLERAVDRVLPEPLNPLAQTGAIAVVTFLVACVTGMLLLFWYSSSVHQAYASVEAMGQAPLTAGLVRSLHRYSSDACMLFVVLHALRLFTARRFAGARTLAWVTGVVLVGLLGLVGWLGYWLIWDEAAQQVAVGTARMLDVLPIFADPLSRAFLADSQVNSLLFFVVFFVHMLLPLAMALPLWLHITRLSRARFLTRVPLTAWVLGALVVVSLAVPAALGGPAKLTVPPERFPMDAWFLLPLALTDRLGGGALWALVLGGGALVTAVPWWMARRRASVAQIEVAKCNGCTLCYEDCPYEAISLVPRTDGRRFAEEARVNADRCVGCGICAGACDPGAINLVQLPVQPARRHLDAWVDEATAAGEAPYLAFVCGYSVGESFPVDTATGLCSALPGYRVFPVPCAGWVQPRTLERAFKRGARGVLVVGCGPGECTYREGAKWTELRLSGERRPALRPELAPPERVRFLRLDPTRLEELTREAARFREGHGAPAGGRSLPARALGAAAVLLVSCGLMAAGSQVSYSGPPASTELVVSFKHPGRGGEHCREQSPEELAKLPVHMRQPRICERVRPSVRLRVRVDGAVVLERAYAPGGLAGDGNSLAVERLPVEPGRHVVSVELGETADPAEWTFREERAVDFSPRERRVLLFDRLLGFTWHGGSPGTET